ncbi:AMP-binding protein [Marinomonas sp. A79]|uniref:AMP-binding protein n=1 Tax=Marinomonas vulgaris TaxID=2823372 RepID=A0ABS5HCD7_9GAMM|nr:AMP-binding protein [Marinomonas vulgaris]MBR7889317.1 AMP-binding protein [Marinomonas vulgaris]
MPSKLLDYIKLIPSDRFFLKTDGKNVTYMQLYKFTSDFIEEYSCLKGKNCALISQDRFSLALYLPAVDYLASSVFLQANDLDSSVVNNFYEKAGIEFIVTISKNNKIDIKSITSLKSYNIANGWLMATSGTTGSPKLVSYTLDRLISTAQKNIKRGADYNWGLCYDLNRFAGLQVYLQVVVAGSTLTISENDHSIHDMVNVFSINEVNAISATPSFWQKVLMSENSSQLQLTKITLGGEISTQSILDALAYQYKGATITHIYASTEAGVGFAVKDKRSGFPVGYLTENNGLDISIKIIDKELWIKSLRSNTQLLEGNLEVDEQGYVNTGDLVESIQDRVVFLGRSSGAINVGGNKVMPEKIEVVINENDIVSYSRVFGKSNSMIGSIVCAEIVLTAAGKSLDKKEVKKTIISQCKNELETYEVPVLLKFVDSIAINSTGKLIRF